MNFYNFFIVILAASVGYLLSIIFQNKDDYLWSKEAVVFEPNYPPPQFLHYSSDEVTREDVFIPISNAKGNGTIHGWLFLPVEEENSATAGKPKSVVLITTGLGSQKDMGLEYYGGNFAKAGFAALLIDYQHFGGSTSDSPLRNWINPWNHVQDIISTVEAIESGVLGPRVKSDSIALWGTSFAGGHILVVTDELKKRDKASSIKCLISQVSHLDGRAVTQRGLKQRGIFGTAKILVFALTDLIASFFNASPLYVKIVGSEDDVAYMILPKEQRESYFRKHPKTYLGGWKNWAPARTLALLSLYSPKNVVQNIDQPILFVAATKDALCPIEKIREAATSAKKGKLVEIDTNHFNIYLGENVKYATEEMIKFLKKHLRRTSKA